MTVVNVRLFESALGGAGPVPVGFVRAEPFAGLVPRVDVSADVVTLPRPLLVHVSDGDPQVSIDLEPTGPAWLWRITVGLKHGPQLVRNVAVPGSPVPVAFADLIDVDPYTMGPAPEQIPGWTALLEEISTALVAVRADRAAADSSATSAHLSAESASTSKAAAEESATTAHKANQNATANALAASGSAAAAAADAGIASAAVIDVRARTVTVAPNPADPGTVLITFPVFMATPDGAGVVLPIGA